MVLFLGDLSEVFKNEVFQYLPQTLKWFIKQINTLCVLMCTHVYTHPEEQKADVAK